MKLIIVSSVYSYEADVMEVEVGDTLNLIALILKGFMNGKNHSKTYRALLGLNDKGDIVITNYDDCIE